MQRACARWPDDTDWARILAFYDELVVLNPSPVVALNRAVAVGRVRGPRMGLEAAAEAARHPMLSGYHLKEAVLGALHEEAGEALAAADRFGQAASLAPSEQERRYLEARRARALEG